MPRRSSIQCQLAGIPAMLVTGDVNGEATCLEYQFSSTGDWYYIDPTWETLPIEREEGKKRQR